MNNFIKKSRAKFIKELEIGDYMWRICRLTSFVDMIFVSISHYRANPVDSNLSIIFNMCVKSLIIDKIGEFDLAICNISNTNSLFQKIENELTIIINTYDILTIELDGNIARTDKSLFDDEIYIKTLLNLEIDVYPTETVRNIATLVLNISKCK